MNKTEHPSMTAIARSYELHCNILRERIAKLERALQAFVYAHEEDDHLWAEEFLQEAKELLNDCLVTCSTATISGCGNRSVVADPNSGVLEAM